MRLLRRVVGQELEGQATQRNDSDQVDNDHGGGEGIGQCPHQWDGADRAAEHAEDNQGAEGHHHGLAVGEVLHIGLCQVVVSQHRGEGEEEQNERDEVSSPIADLGAQSVLGEVCGLNAFTVGRVGQQNDECGDRADDEGIEIHAEGLEYLLYGWETAAVAAALGAEPWPASLENRPRRMPFMKAAPTAAPVTSLKPSAWPTIKAKHLGCPRY